MQLSGNIDGHTGQRNCVSQIFRTKTFTWDSEIPI